MNKKGFTLIELLAVLIVLSIILLIAVPRILDAVEVSRKKSFEISANKLIQEASKEFAKDNLEKEYTITNGSFEGNKLDVKGDMPKEGSIFISEDGESSIAVHNDKYCALKATNDDNVYVIDYDGYECRVTTPKSCFTYTKTSTQVTITGYDNACDKDVIIPSSFEGLPVTTIGSSAFSNNQLTSVVIPSSVTSIGESAFSWNQLTSVVIPSSVTSIGNWAFYYNQLTSVVIPSSVTSIGDYAFYDNQLTSIVIPSSVTSIGAAAFYNNQLTSVVIPSSVTSIGSYAFYLNQLTSVVIPPSVINIERGAFNNNQLPDNQAFIYKRNSDGSEDKTTIVSYGGAKRDNASIPNSVTSIGEAAFSDNQLTSVVIPSSVTSIGIGAFYWNQLTSVIIPSSVTSIGDEAFYWNQLTSVDIPSSVTSIGAYAFSWNQLTSIVIPSSVTLSDYSISPSFYTSYVTNNNKVGGTYTAPSQNGVWTKQ